MDAVSSRQELSSTLAHEPGVHLFQKYYTDKDYFLSPEGLLKVLSALFASVFARVLFLVPGIIVCIVSSVLFLSGGTCAGAPWLVASAATVALVCAAVTALVYTGVLLGVPLYAPQAYLFTDIILSTVIGILLLFTAVLSMTVCEFNTVVSYMHGPLAMVNSGLVMASAVITYVSMMRLWDAVRQPYEPPRPTPTEQEV